jgi:hypothetical protein
MTVPDLSELFDRAREASIEAVAGGTLFRAGRRMRGECPLCGASKGKRSDGAFSVDPEARVFKCFACGLGGDVIDLEQRLRGGTPREAAERLVGAAPAGVTRPIPVRSAPAAISPTGATAHAAVRIWREAVPASGTLAEAYLAGRGIVGPVARAALTRLRFHPNAYWGEDEGGTRIWLPAMVAQLRAPGGLTGGVHLTYLARDGRKSGRTPAKRMLGPQSLAGAPGAAWLAGPGGSRAPLIVGEGIESTLSAGMLTGWPCRLVATLSLGRLQGVWLPDQWGRIDPECITLDPERPVFTWPADEKWPWGEVIVAVDRDMSPIKVKARRASGGSYQREIDAEERARICAGLATQAWRRACPGLPANAVRTIAPGLGRDFNDELLARGMA